LLERLIAQDETETPRSVYIDGLLQIELAEIDCVLRYFRAVILDQFEM
jgi:hypothetical protein